MSKFNFFRWLNEKVNIPIIIILLIMFFSMLIFFYLKADEITKDPCSICAEYMGEKVTCSTGTTYIVQRNYYPNGSITDNKNELIHEIIKNKTGNIKINKSNINGFFTSGLYEVTQGFAMQDTATGEITLAENSTIKDISTGENYTSQ